MPWSRLPSFQATVSILSSALGVFSPTPLRSPFNENGKPKEGFTLRIKAQLNKSGSDGLSFRRRQLAFVFAAAGRALQERTGLEIFLDKVRITAVGTSFRHGSRPRHECAIRISIASVECLAALGAPLHDFAFGTLGAFHADGFLLYVLARGVVAASREFSEAAVLLNHVVAALRAFLVQRDIGFLLRAADLLRGLAVGIAGAGEERAEASFLEHHGP